MAIRLQHFIHNESRSISAFLKLLHLVNNDTHIPHDQQGHDNTAETIPEHWLSVTTTLLLCSKHSIVLFLYLLCALALTRIVFLMKAAILQPKRQ